MSTHHAASIVGQTARNEPVIRASAFGIQRKCSCGGEQEGAGGCEACRKKKKQVQRKPAARAPRDGLGLVGPIVRETLRAPGRSLDRRQRTDMESRLGHDFSRVRIHADPRAAASAEALHAEAYTVGADIVWGARAPALGSSAGRRLLAHELVHVVQQDGQPADHGSLSLDDARGPAEAEAERVARGAMAGDSPAVRGGSGPRIQRSPFSAPIGDPLFPSPGNRRRLEQRLTEEPGPPQVSLGVLTLPHCPLIAPNEADDGNLKEAMCLTASSRKASAACQLTQPQQLVLMAARGHAKIRVDRALARVNEGESGRRAAVDLASRLFDFNPPDAEQIVDTLTRMTRFFAGSGPPFAGRSCGDETCEKAVAYVLGADKLPVYICPRAFLDPPDLVLTVIHEVVHLAGIDADPATPEGGCKTFDCATPCLTRDDADAWAHYVNCLGTLGGAGKSE